VISVIVPWQPGCEFRERNWQYLRPLWERFGEVIEGVCTGPWSKGTAVRDGLDRASGDKVIVADADVWVDPTGALEADTPWAVPHLKVHRLSDCATVRMIGGEPWRGLPLDRSNNRDCKPYNGQCAGGVVVLNRAVIEACLPDPRFVGWGHEDVAWDAALTSLYGLPWRGNADLVHLWHPSQPRLDRATGSLASKHLMRRYLNAARRPDLIRGILMEVSWESNRS
jgi:hypothetical protein